MLGKHWEDFFDEYPGIFSSPTYYSTSELNYGRPFVLTSDDNRSYVLMLHDTGEIAAYVILGRKIYARSFMDASRYLGMTLKELTWLFGVPHEGRREQGWLNVSFFGVPYTFRFNIVEGFNKDKTLVEEIHVHDEAIHVNGIDLMTMDQDDFNNEYWLNMPLTDETEVSLRTNGPQTVSLGIDHTLYKVTMVSGKPMNTVALAVPDDALALRLQGDEFRMLDFKQYGGIEVTTPIYPELDRDLSTMFRKDGLGEVKVTTTGAATYDFPREGMSFVFEKAELESQGMPSYILYRDPNSDKRGMLGRRVSRVVADRDYGFDDGIFRQFAGPEGTSIVYVADDGYYTYIFNLDSNLVVESYMVRNGVLEKEDFRHAGGHIGKSFADVREIYGVATVVGVDDDLLRVSYYGAPFQFLYELEDGELTDESIVKSVMMQDLLLNFHGLSLRSVTKENFEASYETQFNVYETSYIDDGVVIIIERQKYFLEFNDSGNNLYTYRSE